MTGAFTTEAFVSALVLTTLAGLATTIGSLIALFLKRPSATFMSFVLGFSAGVMILVSFVELFAQAVTGSGFGIALIAFLAGFFFIYGVDLLVPHHYIAEQGADGDGPRERDPLMTHAHVPSASGEVMPDRSRIARAGMLVALGVGIHNFPEGMATFASALANPAVGLAIATAIAIHNIPEGIAVSAPIYAATGERKKAFFWSFLSGISEPIGALIAALILLPFLTPSMLGIALGVVGGIMVFISLDELLPVSRAYGKEHASILGVAAGMAVMGFSLYLLRP